MYEITLNPRQRRASVTLENRVFWKIMFISMQFCKAQYQKIVKLKNATLCKIKKILAPENVVVSSPFFFIDFGLLNPIHLRL